MMSSPDNMNSNALMETLKHPFFQGFNLVAVISAIVIGSSSLSNLYFRVEQIEKWKESNAELNVKLNTLDLNTQNITKELTRLRDTNESLSQEIISLKYEIRRTGNGQNNNLDRP